MTTKQYLGQIRHMDGIIRCKMNDLFNLRTMSTNISVSVGDDKVQTSGPKDKMSGVVAKIVDEENAIVELIDRYFETRNKIIQEIESIDDDNVSHLLYLRYVNCEKFEDIASSMHYTWRNIMYLHKKSLRVFEETYGSQYKK